jgi:Ca-activated chloride channel homolog
VARVGILLLAAVLASHTYAAQGPGSGRGARFRSGVDLVTVSATVVDGEGHLVTGLPREAFEIFEDGERQRIAQFTNERVPISVAVLLDVSDSMFGQRYQDARAAAERFLFDLLDSADEYSVVAFNHEPHILTAWTQTPDVVRRAFDVLQPFGSTAMYDAVLATIPLIAARDKPRTSILIISDGADTASDATIRDVRSALVRSDAFVYAIAIDPPKRQAINQGVNIASLTELTTNSGGHTEVVHDTSDLIAATSNIADELNKQYVLAYSSPRAPDGGYHSIRVRAGSAFRVRARNGYIAAPRQRNSP